MSLIELKNIQFSYSNSKKLTLDIPQLKIEKGERVFVYGPSGCGKSTLLEILAGVLTPQLGQVQVLETDLAKLSDQGRDQFRAAHMGYVFQSFNLIPYLNVEENIELPLHLSATRRSRCSDSKAEISQLCRDLGIFELLQRPVTALSIGQQQRVAVARALLGHPELILADEPTSSLDYDHREKFLQTLFQVCQKAQSTVIFVSHDRSLEKIFDRTLSFNEINKVSGL